MLNFCDKLELVSSKLIIKLSFAKIGPASSSLIIFIVQTPVSLSPAIKALSIGAAPRHLGNKEGCKFTNPNFGTPSNFDDKI